MKKNGHHCGQVTRLTCLLHLRCGGLAARDIPARWTEAGGFPQPSIPASCLHATSWKKIVDKIADEMEFPT